MRVLVVDRPSHNRLIGWNGRSVSCAANSGLNPLQATISRRKLHVEFVGIAPRGRDCFSFILPSELRPNTVRRLQSRSQLFGTHQGDVFSTTRGVSVLDKAIDFGEPYTSPSFLACCLTVVSSFVIPATGHCRNGSVILLVAEAVENRRQSRQRKLGLWHTKRCAFPRSMIASALRAIMEFSSSPQSTRTPRLSIFCCLALRHMRRIWRAASRGRRCAT